MDYNMSPSRLAKFQKIENICCWEAAGKAAPSYVMGGIQPKTCLVQGIWHYLIKSHEHFCSLT